MDHRERLERAAQAYRTKAEGRRYLLTWRGGGKPLLYVGSKGFEQLTTELRVAGATLNNYFSSKKNLHSVKRVNPTTGVEDIATIERIDPPAKEKRPRGRPRKVIDWERMGSEAPGYMADGYTEQPEFFPRKHAKSQSKNHAKSHTSENKLRDV